MAKITFLGGEETGNVAFTDWGGYRFVINQPVEVTDEFIIKKARNNRFYSVGSDMIQADVEDIEVISTTEPTPDYDQKPPLPQRDPMPRRRGRKVASNG